MKVALVCVAKNEDNYIDEWVRYYVKLGVDTIFMYQNDWRTDYEHPNLIKLTLDGSGQQLNSYNDWLRNRKGGFDWVAFFDMDEFLVLKKHNTIQEFVSDYQNQNGIGINWYLFGNNGHENVTNGDYSQIKRFTKRQATMDIHVKTILNCHVNCFMGVHNPNGLPIVSPNGIQFSGPFNTNPNNEIAQLNHYYCKTPEEFLKKCERGRADLKDVKNTFDSSYHPHNFNDVEDLWAYDFMYKN